MRLCSDGRDVKWCSKVATTLSVPPGWMPLVNHVNCNYLDSNETRPNGQWIRLHKNEDGNTYHCLNRKDEDPFAKTKKQMEDIKRKKSWHEEVNNSCPDKRYEGKYYRRCLGNRPDRCQCKFVNSFFKTSWKIKLGRPQFFQVELINSLCFQENQVISSFPKTSNQIMLFEVSSCLES